MNGKAPGSGSMETQGSPARCVAAAAAAQCPARGTPQRGEAEAHGDPGPAGRIRGRGRSPRGWEQGLATPRGAVVLSPNTQAPRALAESLGRLLHARS